MAWWTKISRLIIVMMMITLPAALLAACSSSSSTITGDSGSDGGQVTLKSIQVTPATDSVAIGTNAQFTATATFSDSSTKSVTTSAQWTSSTTATATIGATTGLAVPVAAGTTTITATYQGVKGTASLTVKSSTVTLTSCAVSPLTPMSPVGAMTAFSATGTYSDGTSHELNPVAWSSGTVATATIDASSGVATSVAAGTSVITATSGTVSCNTTLTVTAAVLQSIQVTAATTPVSVGQTDQFTAMGNYGGGVVMDITTMVMWSSATPTVGTIDPMTGLATAVAPGSSVITATLGSISGTGTLVVSTAMLTGLAISPATASIAAGQTQQFTATGTFSDMSTQNLTLQASWSSSTTTVATIGMSTGLATGVAAGMTTITATYMGQMATATLTVATATLASCTIAPNPGTSTPGGAAVDFVATGVFTDGTTNNITTTATFTSSAPAIATVGPMTGIATPVSAGTAIITATSGTAPNAITCSASFVVAGMQITSITITPANPTIANGTTEQFTVTANLAGGTTQNVTSSATYSSGTPTTATIESSTGASPGLATAVATGTTTITATYQGQTATTVLTVSPATLVSIALSPSNAQTLPIGASITFKAIGTYSDGTTQDLSATAGFTQSTANVVTLAQNVATGKTAGTTNITASVTVGTTTINSNVVPVTVVAATLKSIAITPSPSTNIHVGSTEQFTVTGTYTDGTTANLTTQAAWTSSAPATATIGAATGLATGVAPGTTNIGASVGTVMATPVALTVSTGTLVSIAVTPNPGHLTVGQTLQFTATATYSDGTTGNVSNTVSWVSAAPADFTVSSTGLVTGLASDVAAGAQNLTATIGTIQGVAKVTVTSATITKIALQCLTPNYQSAGALVGTGSPYLTCIPTGIGLQLDCTANATYSDGSTGDVTGTATFASSAAATASTGGLTTIGTGTQQYEIFTINGTAGSSNLTAAQGGVTSNTLVTSGVTESLNLAATSFGTTGPLDVITSTGGVSPQTVFAGTTTQFDVIANYTPTGTCTAAESEFDVTQLATWSTVAPTVATVSNAAGSKGQVTGVGAGSTGLSATFGGQAGTLELTVSGACLQTLTIAQTGNPYPEEVEIPLTINAVFSGSANPVALTPATASTYLQANPSVTGPATPSVVFNTNALFVDSGNTAGAGTITFTAKNGVSCTGTVQGTAKITVDTTTLPTSLSLTPASEVNIPVGTQVVYTATAAYGAPYNTSYNVSQYSTWTTVPASNAISYSADPNSPNELQNDTLTAAGSYTVNASYRNVTATATESFSSAKTITGIQISNVTVGAPNGVAYNGTVPGDLPLTFTTTVMYSDGTNATNVAGTSFTSMVPAILPNPTGVPGVSTTVTPAAASTTEVTATITDPTNNKIWTSPAQAIAVNTAKVASLSYNPTSPYSMPLGSSVPLAITANFNNGQSFPVGALVSSSSPDTTIVKVTTTATGTVISSQQKNANATLTIIFDGFTSSFTVDVTTAVCGTSITLTPSNDPVQPFGGQQQFTAVENNSDGTTTPITNSATFTDNAGTNLTNNGGGLFTVPNVGATAGSYTVTASLSSANGICPGGVVGTGTQTITQTVPFTTTAAAVTSLTVYMLDGTSGFTQDPNANLPLGTSRSIQVIGNYSNGTSSDVTASCTFTSGDPTNVTVSAAGVITGQHAGAAGINVVYSPNTAITGTLSVTVAACLTPTIAITPAGATNVAVGYTQAFTATADFNTSATACTNFTANQLDFNATTLATWTSSNTADATIGSNTGVLTGVAAGTVTVTATYDGGTATNTQVNVVTEMLVSITLNNGANVSVPLGGTTTLTVTFTWNPPCAACTTPVNFGEGTPGTVSINPTTYVLTGIKTGSTSVNASSGTTTSNVITATVTPACVSSINLATVPSSGTTIPVGVPISSTVTCQNSDGSACNASNATISTGGSLSGGMGAPFEFAAGTTAGSTGSATASLTAGACGTGVSSKATFTAGTATLQSIALSPSGATVQVGATQQYQAEGTYTGTTGAGTYDISALVALNSTNTPVASVNGDVATGVSMGSTNISAAYQGVNSAEIPLTVSDTNPALTSLTITAAPNSVALCPNAAAACNATSAAYLAGGYTLPLFATGKYADGSTQDLTTKVTWNLATFMGTAGAGPTINGQTGVLTTGTGGGVQPVTATITVGTTVTTSATFDVTIDAGTITSAKIVTTTDGTEPATINVADNATIQLESVATTGTGTYWTTTNFAWNSSMAAVGSVSNGLYTALEATGTTNVSASKVSATATITAGPQVIDDTNATPTTAVCALSSLSKTAGTTSLAAVGDTIQLYVTVTFSDGSVQDETTQATWNTSNNDVTILGRGSPNAGLATARAVGTTTLTPAITGLTGAATACSITVQ